MHADKVLIHLNQIFCPNDKGRALRGKEMGEARLMEQGYIAIQEGKILAVGEGTPPDSIIGEKTKLIDCTGKTATPGLIDSHTHLVYGGTRENEFAKKTKRCRLFGYFERRRRNFKYCASHASCYVSRAV